MARGYLDKSGNYYESDGDFGDTPVPKRPSEDHEWSGTDWVLSTALQAERLAAESKEQLAATDAAMGRAVEDLYAALTAKGVLTAADVPAPVKELLARRAQLRERLGRT